MVFGATQSEIRLPNWTQMEESPRDERFWSGFSTSSRISRSGNELPGPGTKDEAEQSESYDLEYQSSITSRECGFFSGPTSSGNLAATRCNLKHKHYHGTLGWVELTQSIQARVYGAAYVLRPWIARA